MNEATAGAALKYHIKRALERSHSISDFSKQLELSAKNSKFTNNTLKIIEELNNGVKQASEEIKEKATKYEKALKELQKIDESKLTKEQQQVLKVFKGELDQAEIKGIDLNDLHILEQGSRHAGAKKILIKHYGEESTGGLTNNELLNMGEVIKNGSVLLESFEKRNNGFRYAYEWDNNGVKLRLVVDDLNDGNKIFDFYSDRNFKDFRDARPQPSTSKDSRPLPTTLNEPNLTQKPLTSQEDLLKTQENALKTTENPLKPAQTPLSPLEQANAEKLAKLESEKLESGNKIFDFYSDRNFTDFRDARPQPSTSKDSRPLPTTLNEPNLTPKPLTSQEDLLKTRENLKQNTQDNDTILRTFIPNTPKRYVRNHVRDADIIHSFIQPNRTAKSDDALDTVVVYGENTTKKPLTSQEDLLKTRENLFITEI